MTAVLGAVPEHPGPPPVSRLAIAPNRGVPRRIDGAWWPHSADLVAELPELLAALPFDWPRITHATVNGPMWSALPGHTLVAGHVVRLRRTAERPGPHTICLVSPGNGRWDLLVVPPDTPEPEAVRVLAAAAAGADDLTPA
ncbi:DUF5994 family protein [Streptomyces sp. x-80]|uniref:DUF5994 family protein n=1 Tax=Streptomyces sp. x-80 TaxID=2789282 RepID=UPI00397EC366